MRQQGGVVVSVDGLLSSFCCLRRSQVPAPAHGPCDGAKQPGDDGGGEMLDKFLVISKVN